MANMAKKSKFLAKNDGIYADLYPFPLQIFQNEHEWDWTPASWAMYNAILALYNAILALYDAIWVLYIV